MNHSIPTDGSSPPGEVLDQTDLPTIFVVDDDDGVLRSLEQLLAALNLQFKAYQSGERFLNDYDGVHGCLITDLRLPSGLTGMELQARMLEQSIDLPVIVITAFAETSLTVQAMQKGAITLLEKPYRDHELLEAIHTALEVDRKRRDEQQRTHEVLYRLDNLTRGEKAVLDLVLDGVINKVIAKQLNVSVRTIENRRKRIYAKMHTDSVAALVKMVVEARNRSDN